MERLDFDLLFRWFVGLGIDDPVLDATVFTKNRDRLLTTEIARGFLGALLALPRVKTLLSSPPDAGRNGERDFRGEKRSNETHASTTDPDSRLYRKGNGRESVLCYMGHALMENRNGLAVAGTVTHATGTAEREAALTLLARPRRRAIHAVRRTGRITLGGDKGYDVAGFVAALRELKVTPHIAINGHISKHGVARKTAVDGRVTRHPGYAISQVIRKRVEEIFGWAKPVGGLAQVKLRGIAKVSALFTLGLAAYDLVRIPKLLGAPA